MANGEKVTLYWRNEFGMGIVKVEATALTVTVKPYAQYVAGVFAHFLPKRKRKMRGIVQGYAPSLLVLEGWGHPEPDGMFLEARQTDDGVTVAEGRYGACDPGWQDDFNAKIATYLAKTGAKVLHDFREHNPHRPYESPEVKALLATMQPAPELPEGFGAEG